MPDDIYRDLTSHLFQPPRDFILRPVDAEPGIYEPEGEAPYMVARHEGKTYRVFTSGDTKPEAGDIVLKDAYLASMTTHYPEDSCVVAESIVFSTEEGPAS